MATIKAGERKVSRTLAINIDDLLHCRVVESVRVEFKAGWDPKTTGRQVLKTICAFANDLQSLNGGYVVLGVQEADGRAVLPPAGLTPDQIAEAQKWIRGNCNRIDPVYQPVVSPESVNGRHILVVWAPPSDTRPHAAPEGPGKERRFWIRLGAETVDAQANGMLQALIETTARVPWDDRRALQARVEDLRAELVREYLRDVRSGLIDQPDTVEIYRRMRLTVPVNGHDVPRNVGLLFFSDAPQHWFRGAWIEVVQFAAGRAGEVQEERTFKGSLVTQLRACLDYLENLSEAHLKKERDRIQVRRWVNYPLRALRETLVNALYHRGYQESDVEPTKVYLHPDRIEIVSYPGPVAGIELRDLEPNANVPLVPPRNRRIGDFLRELRLAEQRLTGLPRIFQAMEENGSPVPRFDFDKGRTYFRATLPAHPEYRTVSTLRDVAYLRAVGDHDGAFRRLEAAWRKNLGSAAVAAEMVRSYAERDDLDAATGVLANFKRHGPRAGIPSVTGALIEVLFEGSRAREARDLLTRLPGSMAGEDAIMAAMLARRFKEEPAAHRYFEQVGAALDSHSRALHEYAQTKIWLAAQASRERRRGSRGASRRLLGEARSLLERVIQLEAPDSRHAWAWRDLGRVLNRLRAPVREVEQSYRRAIALLPDEERFKEELHTLRSRWPRPPHDA